MDEPTTQPTIDTSTQPNSQVQTPLAVPQPASPPIPVPAVENKTPTVAPQETSTSSTAATPPVPPKVPKVANGPKAPVGAILVAIVVVIALAVVAYYAYTKSK
jgi:hypothetical protein